MSIIDNEYSNSAISEAIGNYVNSGVLISDESDNNIALVFDIIDDHSMQFQSAITDNWLENNTAVQDAIAINPIQITLTGLVGEIVFTPPKTWREFITEKLNSTKLGANLTQKLSVIPALLPEVDNYTQLAKNAVDYAENAFEHYKSLYETVRNIWQNKENPASTKQQIVAQNLLTAWQNKTSFTVITPWGEFKQMYILNGNFKQAATNTVSNLTVTLKQMNFYDEIQFTGVNKAVRDKYNANPQSPEENHGLTPGKNESLAKSIRFFG